MVGFIDMDCFYVAVERTRDARLRGKACAVVQYPTQQRGRPDLRPADDRWRTAGPMGGIIAVSYEARARGVTRQMSGHEAKKAGPRWPRHKLFHGIRGVSAGFGVSRPRFGRRWAWVYARIREM